MVRLYCPPIRFLIAGEVCRRLNSNNPIVTMLGKMASIEEFYAEVDVIVAPMVFSTGIKIKVGEALGFGKGVVSTINGFDGYPAMDPMHALASLRDVSRALIKLAFDEERRSELISKSRMAATRAEQSTAMSFKGLARAIRDRIRRVVFIVDAPYWNQTGFRAARLAQWAELCGYLMPIIVWYLGTTEAITPQGRDTKALAIEHIDISEVRHSNDVESLAAKLDARLKMIGRTEVMLSLQIPWAADLCAALIARGHRPIVDLWCRPFAEAASKIVMCARGDLWATEDAANGIFETSSLRFAPSDLNGWSERQFARRVVLVGGSGTREAEAAVAEIGVALLHRDLPLDVIAGEDSEKTLECLYEYWQKRGRPLLLLSIGGSAKLSQACRAVSAIGRVPYFDINRSSFPLALWDEQENLQMFYDRYDLMGQILNRLDTGAPISQTLQAPDAGWSRLWRRLERGVAPGKAADVHAHKLVADQNGPGAANPVD
jgi:hypothetical protein